jgi:hypothetical protein
MSNDLQVQTIFDEGYPACALCIDWAIALVPFLLFLNSNVAAIKLNGIKR